MAAKIVYKKTGPIHSPGYETKAGAKRIPSCVCSGPDEELTWLAELKWSVTGLSQLDKNNAAANGGLFIRHHVNIVGYAIDRLGQLCIVHFGSYNDLFPVNPQTSDVQELDRHWQDHRPIPSDCPFGCLLFSYAQGEATLNYVHVAEPNPKTGEGPTRRLDMDSDRDPESESDDGWINLGWTKKVRTPGGSYPSKKGDPLWDQTTGTDGRFKPGKLIFEEQTVRLQYGYPAAIDHCPDVAQWNKNSGQRPTYKRITLADQVPDANKKYYWVDPDLKRHDFHFGPGWGEWSVGTDSRGGAYENDVVAPGLSGPQAALAAFWTAQGRFVPKSGSSVVRPVDATRLWSSTGINLARIPDVRFRDVS